MAKVKMTVKPSQGSQLADAPKSLTVGTKIEAVGNSWNYKKGDTAKSGKVVEEPNAGQVVKAGATKFAMRFDKLADDLLKGKRSEEDLKAAGIVLNKLEDGNVSIEVSFPNSAIGIEKGQYYVPKAPVQNEE